jgi:hypothetical protein
MCFSLAGILLVSVAAIGQDPLPIDLPQDGGHHWLIPETNWPGEPVDVTGDLLVRGNGMAGIGCYAFVDFLSLQHAGSGSFPLLTRDADNSTVLDAKDIQFPMGFGPRVGLVLSGLLFGFDLDLGYFDIPQWSATQSPGDTGGLYVPFWRPGNPASPNLTFNYLSRLQSAELSVGWPLISQTLSLTGGFRWFELKENLGATADGGGTTFGLFNSEITNELYTLQLGLDAWLSLGDKFAVGGDLKGGIGGDAAQHDLGGTVNDAPVSSLAKGSHLCYFGEADVTLAVTVMQNVYMRIGYELLYLDGIDMAVNQLSSDYSSGNFRPVFNGHLLAHGPTAGLEIVF